jgi:hypothetical protein
VTEDLRRDLRELPPPSLDVPGDFYERVIATVRRRRRARWAGCAAVALAVSVASVAVGLSSSGGSSTARLVPVTPATSTPSAGSPKGTPSAAAGPGFVPVSVSFVSSELGWAYGPERPTAAQGPGPFIGELAVTHDGGQHWTKLPAPGVDYFTSGGAASVRFVDSNRGYLYGDALFETTDGGLHWRPLTAPGPVMGLAATGSSLYVLALSCPASEPLCGASALYRGRLDGSGFVRMGAVGEMVRAQLSAVGSRVFLLSSPAGNTVPAGPVPATLATSQDGEHWSISRTPCDTTFPDYGAVAPATDGGLALVCGAQPAVGAQPKTAYVSTDNGANWTPRGSAFPGGGYVGSLAAADESTWVLSEQRGTLLVTHDGGNSWSEARIQGLTQGVDSWGQVVFTDAEHAVAVPDGYYANGLLLSSDAGSTWSAISFSP